jgi:hypothetical protein
MARQTAINTSDDMRWLRKAHLPQLPAKYKSAIIFGNEDYPKRIEVYEQKDPRVTDVPVIFETDDEGVFRKTQQTSSTRHHAAKKSPAELDREIAEVLGRSTSPNAAEAEEVNFSSSDIKGVVAYRSKPVAFRSPRGWTPIESGSTNVDRAVRAAIFNMPNEVSASELRHEITARL